MEIQPHGMEIAGEMAGEAAGWKASPGGRLEIGGAWLSLVHACMSISMHAHAHA